MVVVEDIKESGITMRELIKTLEEKAARIGARVHSVAETRMSARASHGGLCGYEDTQ